MFHISLPCEAIEKTREFYLDIPSAAIGREGHNWFDINFFGNQITFIEAESNFDYPNYRFESQSIPSFHFGIVLEKDDWNELLNEIGVKNNIEVTLFLEGKSGEHRSFFITDPNGYTIEFKCFSQPEQAFSKN